MQISQIINIAVTTKDQSLYGLVDSLVQEASPLAVHNHNYIVNNIPRDLLVETNDTIVSSVLSKLFDTSFRHTRNSVILISARVYGMAVLVHIKTRGHISPALPEDIGHACLKAQKTGGIIEMIECESNQASIAYCFLNIAGAA